MCVCICVILQHSYSILKSLEDRKVAVDGDYEGSYHFFSGRMNANFEGNPKCHRGCGRKNFWDQPTYVFLFGSPMRKNKPA